MRVASWDDVNEIEPLSNFQQTMMLPVFSMELVSIKLRPKKNNPDFIECVLGLLMEV
jgi:hypothetical protein